LPRVRTGTTLPAVFVDQGHGIHQAVHYLLDLGHRQFEFCEVRATPVGVDEGEVLRTLKADAVERPGRLHLSRRHEWRFTLIAPLDHQRLVAGDTEIVNSGFLRQDFRPEAAGQEFEVRTR
jgi:hypothetical protein